jgi:hypothetical protein
MSPGDPSETSGLEARYLPVAFPSMQPQSILGHRSEAIFA